MGGISWGGITQNDDDDDDNDDDDDMMASICYSDL